MVIGHTAGRFIPDHVPNTTAFQSVAASTSLRYSRGFYERIAGDGVVVSAESLARTDRYYGCLRFIKTHIRSSVMAELYADKNGATPKELILNFGRQKLAP